MTRLSQAFLFALLASGPALNLARVQEGTNEEIDRFKDDEILNAKRPRRLEAFANEPVAERVFDDAVDARSSRGGRTTIGRSRNLQDDLVRVEARGRGNNRRYVTADTKGMARPRGLREIDAIEARRLRRFEDPGPKIYISRITRGFEDDAIEARRLRRFEDPGPKIYIPRITRGFEDDAIEARRLRRFEDPGPKIYIPRITRGFEDDVIDARSPRGGRTGVGRSRNLQDDVVRIEARGRGRRATAETGLARSREFEDNSLEARFFRADKAKRNRVYRRAVDPEEVAAGWALSRQNAISGNRRRELEEEDTILARQAASWTQNYVCTPEDTIRGECSKKIEAADGIYSWRKSPSHPWIYGRDWLASIAARQEASSEENIHARSYDDEDEFDARQNYNQGMAYRGSGNQHHSSGF